MLRDNNEVCYEKMRISITEHSGLYDLREILGELRMYRDNFLTDSMNDRVLYLQGQKEMLIKIIKYLENCL